MNPRSVFDQWTHDPRDDKIMWFYTKNKQAAKREMRHIGHRCVDFFVEVAVIEQNGRMAWTCVEVDDPFNTDLKLVERRIKPKLFFFRWFGYQIKISSPWLNVKSVVPGSASYGICNYIGILTAPLEREIATLEANLAEVKARVDKMITTT